jgi:hypothetical protein
VIRGGRPVADLPQETRTGQRDDRRIFTDPRTRQSEKEFFELRGIQEAPCSICSNIQWSPRMDLTIVGAGRRSQRRSPFAR